VPGCGYRFSAAVGDDQAALGAAAAAAAAPTNQAVTSNHIAINSNLPSDQAALFGRDADVSLLEKMLADHRLVSIVGAAGIGKTSVAAAVANSVMDKFSDGVWFLELAAVSDSDLVIEIVASALKPTLTHNAGTESEATLLQLAELISKRIGDREMLIVFDNCEHQLESVAVLVTAINHAAPRIRILITSQEALKLPREQVYRLSTLEIPDAATFEDKIADARATGAVALFEARARSADSRFRVNADNLDAVIDIC
jgi:predicted ATPase